MPSMDGLADSFLPKTGAHRPVGSVILVQRYLRQGTHIYYYHSSLKYRSGNTHGHPVALRLPYNLISDVAPGGTAVDHFPTYIG